MLCNYVTRSLELRRGAVAYARAQRTQVTWPAFDIMIGRAQNVRVIVARACHVTFPKVFVRRYMELDTLSLLLYYLLLM